MFHDLVFRVCDMFNFWIPARAAGSTLVALRLSWAAVEAFIDDRGPMSPGLPWCCIIFCIA